MSAFYRNLITFLVILEVFLYDWGVFEMPAFSALAAILKIAIPLVLFMITFFITKCKIQKYLVTYIQAYVLLAIVSLIACVLSDNIAESILQYVKIIPPRLVLIVALAGLLYNYPKLINKINYGFLIISTLTFIQFLFVIRYLQANPGNLGTIENARGANFVGPFGLYGNIATQFAIDDIFFVRLNGFWHEPSNAAGYLISTFFIGLFLSKRGKKINKMLLILPIIGAILSFSNAGYLAFGVCLFVWVVLTTKNKLVKFIKIIPLIMVAIVALKGRELVAEYFPDYELLKVVVGLRVSEEQLNKGYDDFSAGRVKNTELNVKRALEHPLGIGFRIPGEDSSGNGDKAASPSAVIYLLNYIGIFGLLMVLVLKYIVVQPIFAHHQRFVKKDSTIVLLLCAWVAVTVQNVIYGNWMGMFYYYLSISIIVLALKAGEENPETSEQLILVNDER